MKKLVIVVVAASAFVLAAGAQATAEKTIVRTTLKEFKVLPVPVRAKAGPVAFVVKNTGKLSHEFIVLKTNLAQSKLPRRGAKAVEVGRVGRIVGSVRPGASKTLVLNLKAGKYVLICNLPGHYAAGQHAAFTVTG